ncbi:hypothetical protein [Polymorphospora sp. NPDC050346]|uniref:hypothetical protein n=1 Tax=Polymorphospora sp. NPDC050346 TaxID=3155780 RepID=UPI0033CF520E
MTVAAADQFVTDVRMPPDQTDDGLRAAVEIRRRWPDIAVLVRSEYGEKRYAAKLLADRSEGVGYVLKDRLAQVEALFDALERATAGSTALNPEVVRRLMAAASHTDPLSRLTPWERDVLHHMACPTPPATAAASWRSVLPQLLTGDRPTGVTSLPGIWLVRCLPPRKDLCRDASRERDPGRRGSRQVTSADSTP